MAATEEQLGLLHEAVAQDLLEKIQNGTATPSEISTAVKLLKDNDITALPVENSRLSKLASSLPEFENDEGLYAN